MKKFFSYHKQKGYFRFKIFGYGLTISDRFTLNQKRGHVKYIYFYGYVITFLKLNKF